MRLDIDRGCTPSPVRKNRGARQFGAASFALSDSSGEAGSGGARSMSVKGVGR